MTFTWQGRDDAEDGPLAERWHQRIAKPNNPSIPTLALKGFCTDEGVARNKGRIGAADGPDALRLAAANLPVINSINLLDDGDVEVKNNDLESAQREIANWVSQQLSFNHFPIVMGGGHEIALASYLGWRDWAGPDRSIAIINLDAHLDIRKPNPLGSSGTPFYQIAELAKQDGRDFNYWVIGASEIANTQALFHRASELGVRLSLDNDVILGDLDSLVTDIHAYCSAFDDVYLTIDLDVLQAAYMPAVSAPAAGGLSLAVVETIITAIMSSAKVRLADLAELSPSYDQDGIGAKTAARILHRISRSIV